VNRSALRLALLASVAAASAAGLARAAGEPDPKAPLPSAWTGEAVRVPPGLPTPWVPPSNPLTKEKVELGRRLYFETALSNDGTRSCAHCHDPRKGFGDGRPTALGVRGQVGPRNVPTLANAAIYPALFWDGRAVSLEAQAEGPILAPTELDMTEAGLVDRVKAIGDYRPLFAAAFGSETVTLRRIAQALASFERTLLLGDSPFDRWWFGRDEKALDDAARRGYEVFRTRGGCAGCHSVKPAAAAFTDFEFHATSAGADGDDDPGRFAVTGKPEDRGRFRTPSLRNVALTGPWFHDGSASTLREAIDHYDRGGRAGKPKEPEIRALHLSEEEKADLEAFLRSLSSPALERAAEAAEPATAASPLEAPDACPDAEALRRAAEDVLEASPEDARAMRGLLVAVARVGDASTLDAVIERARPVEAGKDGALLRGALGTALVRRARKDEPADPARLAEGAALLRKALAAGPDPALSLELAFAEHLRGDVPAATAAYDAALEGDERLGERAVQGLRSLLRDDDKALAAALEAALPRHPGQPAARSALAAALSRVDGPAAGLASLEAHPSKGPETPRTLVLRAGLLRDLGRHAEALAPEREALARAGDDVAVEFAVERAWRERRPLASFEDCAALDRDYAALLDHASRDPRRVLSWANNVAFRLRDVVSAFTWRGEGRTQGIAEGAPPAARALLDRCVALYERAVAAIPKDAADRPFEERWTYAGVLNDAGLVRHYFVDVRDLDRAEALYLRAFELTDGAYMDTYFYNLQYLYGLERPGNEEKWFRLARRASERILRETAEGLVPDERKRDAARRDAEGLRRLIEAREAAPPAMGR
jgi:cytochrome c peroxidase